jgi:hypothetical protein
MSFAALSEPYHARGKTPADIERDIAVTRAGIGEVLDTLERQVSPRQLLEKGMEQVMRSMNGNGTGSAGDMTKFPPVPMALIGAGIGWLLLNGLGESPTRGAPERRYAPRRRIEPEPGRGFGLDHPLALGLAGVAAGAALALLVPKSKLDAAYEQAAELGRAAYEQASDFGRAAYDRARDGAERAFDGVRDAIKTAKT